MAFNPCLNFSLYQSIHFVCVTGFWPLCQ
uniref:Uncharacterized protein n=1 Tax=Anguilla anguilla TaxID=7936 RepID=A0A0E9Q4P1_ANGAN